MCIRDRECLVRYVNQHCAHHQRITAVAACSHSCNAILIFSVIDVYKRQTVTSDITLYAKWTKNSSGGSYTPPTYKPTINQSDEGGTCLLYTSFENLFDDFR